MFAVGECLRDRYELQHCLRENPGRETWLAQDLQSSQLVVVKLLLFGGSVQWQDIRLFEREAEILEQLDHPRIPAYRDHFSLEDRTPTYLGLVQAYIAGESLQECLDRGRHFQEKDLQDIAEQVLEIPIYLHALQPPILHRDIKPSNLMRDEEGRIHLIDFGSVQTATAAPERSFTVAGTYGYTPMEQFGGQAVPASDLYALGCTLVHLATGQLPANLAQQDGRIDVAAVSTLSADFVQWLQQLCEPHVSQRPQSAQSARAILELPIEGNFAESTGSLAPARPTAISKGFGKRKAPLSLRLLMLLRQAPGEMRITHTNSREIVIRWQDSLLGQYTWSASPREKRVHTIGVMFAWLGSISLLVAGFISTNLLYLAAIAPFIVLSVAEGPRLQSILTLSENNFSLVGQLLWFSFGRIQTLEKHQVVAIKLVSIRESYWLLRKVYWRKVIEIQTKHGQLHRFTVAGLERGVPAIPGLNVRTAWMAKVLSSWLNIPVIREREDSGRRTLVHPSDCDF